ncbi:MAG: restriction endonuclease subunit S [Anaerolineales bacterium]
MVQIHSGAPTWPRVPLAQVLRQDMQYITELEPRPYPKLSVKLYGRGVVLDAPTDGATVKMARHQFAKPGQVILSEIWAKKGAIGIVPPDGAGALVTSHFFLFNIDETRLHPRFVYWLLTGNYFAEELDAQAHGTTGYAAVRPKQFLNVEIPLPPLAEQQRIVARIEELARRVEEARGLRAQAVEEAEALVPKAITEALDEEGWGFQHLEHVLAESPRNGLSPQSETDFRGKPMLRINAVSSAPTRYVDLTAHKLVEVADKVAEPFVLRDDDVFIVRYNGDIKRVAKAAIFKGRNEDGIVYPDKLMRLRVDRTKMAPDFLVFALSSKRVRTQIEEMGKTTAGQIGISGGDAKSFDVPVPPLPEQHRIVAYLDGLQAKVDELKQLQADTQKELDALMPSILAKAFVGQL